MTIVHEFHGGGAVEVRGRGRIHQQHCPRGPVDITRKSTARACGRREEPDMVAARPDTTERNREDNEICSTWVGSPVSPRKIREHLGEPRCYLIRGAVRRRWRGVDHGGARLPVHPTPTLTRIPSACNKGHPGRFIHPAGDGDRGGVPRAHDFDPSPLRTSAAFGASFGGKEWEGMRETVVGIITFVRQQTPGYPLRPGCSEITSCLPRPTCSA